MLAQRKSQATKERNNDYLATEAKARILSANRASVARRYADGFVSKSEASRCESSPFQWLHTAACWGSGSPRSSSGAQLRLEPTIAYSVLALPSCHVPILTHAALVAFVQPRLVYHEPSFGVQREPHKSHMRRCLTIVRS